MSDVRNQLPTADSCYPISRSHRPPRAAAYVKLGHRNYLKHLRNPMTQHESIVVLDYGSQYSQLIVRRVREAGVYSELLRFDVAAEQALALNPRGIILSGGPNSVYAAGAP